MLTSWIHVVILLCLLGSRQVSLLLSVLLLVITSQTSEFVVLKKTKL